MEIVEGKKMILGDLTMIGKGDELKNITHIEVARYLRDKGWQKVDDLGENGLIDVYRKDQIVIEILVDDGLPSYADRVRHALISIAHVEDRRDRNFILTSNQTRQITIKL